MNKQFYQSLSLTSKIFLILFSILTLFSGLLSLAFYFYLKDKVILNAYEKMNIVFAQMDALGKYVRFNLRPTIMEVFEDLGLNDRFLLEAMSTTHVRKLVMDYFKEKFPQVKYERVSPFPINPKNKFQEFHYILFDKVSKEHKGSVWKGFIKIYNEEYLVIVKAIYVEKPCLQCHSSLDRIPKSLFKYYSLKENLPWKEGDIMGIELVRYPIKEALNEIKAQVMGIFTISVASAFVLLIVLEGLFYSMLIKPLQRINAHFRALREGKVSLKTPIHTDSKDEIGELIQSFNELSHHLDKYQRDLYENFKTLETLFESITHPIALINRACEVEISNTAFKESPYKNCYRDLVERVFNEKKPLHMDLLETNDRRYYHLSLYPVYDKEENVIKVVQIMEDITEKKLMEERLILTEKLAAIGQVSAGLAHEINNPLSGILLLLKEIQRDHLSAEEKQLYFDLINEGLLKIQRLIRDLLNFTRSSELKMEKTSINNLIINLLELSSSLLEKENIKLNLELDPHIPELAVDKEKMSQVFLNLLLNAIQAMESSPEKILTIKSTLREEKIQISFKDTGPGIPEEIKGRIFDPFFTTKPPGKGTGLGLSVSLAIVEKHGGRLYLDEAERGANFIVELPIKNLSLNQGND